jgi:hypothetical protein
VNRGRGSGQGPPQPRRFYCISMANTQINQQETAQRLKQPRTKWLEPRNQTPKSHRSYIPTKPILIPPLPKRAPILTSTPTKPQSSLPPATTPAAPREISLASPSTTATKPATSPTTQVKEFADPPFRGVIHMITKGSSSEFETKRQKKDYYRIVNHVALTEPVVQTKWSHVPLTFDARNINLRSAPHTDALVVNCRVAG